MSLYDDENKIIESFQKVREKNICIIPETNALCKIFNYIYNKENWKVWESAFGKGNPPPDFYLKI
ncbi:MAG: hypothetical protein J6A89_05470 [Clostridia bacterium]|nr:hypothetical protein [Clostridia bacterium]